LKGRVEHDDDGDVRRTAVQELARGWKDDPDTLPLLKARIQSDINAQVREAAFAALSEDWKNEPGLLSFLMGCFLDDVSLRSDELVTLSRLEVLQKAFEDSNTEFTDAKPMEQVEFLSMLSDRIANDPDPSVREWAKEKLEDLTPFLKNDP
ncbi:MAG: HEAT repeat domain-containing protein, partial [Cyanobacteria bacterium J06638_22]